MDILNRKKVKKLTDENENLKNLSTIFRYFIKKLKGEKAKLIDDIAELKVKNEEQKKEYLILNNEAHDDIQNITKKYNNTIEKFLSTYIESINSEEKIKSIYEELRVVDEDGWCEENIVANLIPCNLYSEFYYEDNTGVFDRIDGYGTINYYEIAEFAEQEYEFVGMYERMSGHSDYTNLPKYIEYRKKAEFETVKEIIKKYPLQSFELITPFILNKNEEEGKCQ